jgi:hypothetical protein
MGIKERLYGGRDLRPKSARTSSFLLSPHLLLRMAPSARNFNEWIGALKILVMFQTELKMWGLLSPHSTTSRSRDAHTCHFQVLKSVSQVDAQARA